MVYGAWFVPEEELQEMCVWYLPLWLKVTALSWGAFLKGFFHLQWLRIFTSHMQRLQKGLSRKRLNSSSLCYFVETLWKNVTNICCCMICSIFYLCLVPKLKLPPILSSSCSFQSRERVTSDHQIQIHQSWLILMHCFMFVESIN